MQRNHIYPHSADTAHERGELDLYHQSNRINQACARAIDQAVTDSNYELYHYDLKTAAKSVIGEYGADRVSWVLANVIRKMDYDGRISHAHKDWARELPALGNERPDFYLNTHPAILDGFIQHARKEIENPLRTAELSTEQNYNMIDGRINNLPVPRADLTDGQTHEEIAELAPETLPTTEGKPSLLGRLEQLKAEIPPASEKGAPSGPER